MRTSAELRVEAWKTTREGRWPLKFMVIFLLMSAIVGCVDSVWKSAVTSMGVQTWSMFFDAKLKAMASGLDLSVPSRAVALGMTEVSAFELFFSCIFQGIVLFGICGMFLRAAKGDSERWLSRTLGGFRYPLGVAWLYFRLVLQAMLWLLPFLGVASVFAVGLDKWLGWTVMPALSWSYARFYVLLVGVAIIVGIPAAIVCYRYCQSWNLKVENPDWTAGKCIAESCRMMKGNKWRRFCLDCSYWKPITLILVGVLSIAVISVVAHAGLLPASGTVLAFLAFAMTLACMWGSVVLGAFMSIGQAMLYLDIKGEQK